MDDLLLTDLLYKSFLKNPHKIAIRDEKRSITYKGLEEESTLLANRLLKRGLLPGEVVAVYLDKSIEAVAAFFAVLKTGCAYIPLDSHYAPASRILRIIESAEAAFIISRTALWGALVNTDSHLSAKQAILVDQINDEDINGSASSSMRQKSDRSSANRDTALSAPLEIKRASTDMAYILYTSGSTGIPKGVVISHLNACSFVDWALEYFNPSVNDIFANHAPFHFDLSVFDIYVSIASGATLNLVPFEVSRNPRALIEWIGKNRISFWYSVPSVWIGILNYARIQKNNLKDLKAILFAGEEFPPEYLKRLRNALPFAEYYNLYGPTETNVCTAYHVKNSDKLEDRPVPIGAACKGTDVVVFKENGEEALVGEEGELYVYGPTVTSGYYRNDSLSRKAFRVSPAARHKGALLYGTGDIVFRQDKDNYRFVGRRDFMVKCSGFRIELSEILSLLHGHDKIEEAAVIPVFNKRRGTNVLHGFVKLKENTASSILEIKEFCLDKLPHYMVPEFIEFVMGIPRNFNGKIDSEKLLRSIG